MVEDLVQLPANQYFWQIHQIIKTLEDFFLKHLRSFECAFHTLLWVLKCVRVLSISPKGFIAAFTFLYLKPFCLFYPLFVRYPYWRRKYTVLALSYRRNFPAKYLQVSVSQRLWDTAYSDRNLYIRHAATNLVLSRQYSTLVLKSVWVFGHILAKDRAERQLD